MEVRANYDVEGTVKIRNEALQPAAFWAQASPEEVKEVIRLTGMNGEEVAAYLGLAAQSAASGRGSRTVRRWTAGEVKIPYAAWALLAYKAGFGPIWMLD